MRSARPIRFCVFGLLAIGLCAMPAAAAVEALPVESKASALAVGLGQVTGLAISPVLVLGLFGLVDWWRAADGASLPLHAQPWLWGPLLACCAVATLARTGSVTVPGSKYFLDAPKQIHSKVTALMSAGIFLPTVISSLEAAGVAPPATSGVATAGFAAWAAAPIVVLSFLSVWIVSNTIDALVFLSPVPIVDAILLALRGALLSVVLAVTAFDAWLGFPALTLLLCVPIILVCLIVAGACVRLNLFAFLCAWDFLTRRRRRTRADEGRIRAFVASRHVGAPVRTMGHAEPLRDSIRFAWRPFFVLPVRQVEITARKPVIVRGVIWSSVTVEHEGRPRPAFSFPPRYLGHEPALAARFGASVRDGALRRGLRGTIAFVRGMFGFADRAVPASE